MLEHLRFGLISRQYRSVFLRALISIRNNEIAKLLITLPIQVCDIFKTGFDRDVGSVGILPDLSLTHGSLNGDIVVGIDHAADVDVRISLRTGSKRTVNENRILKLEVVRRRAARSA